jgi:hypothetical protein
MIKPITPDEVLEKKLLTIPEAMLQAVNELIVLMWNGSSTTIRKDELITRYCYIVDELEDRAMVEQLEHIKAFDFEHIYIFHGWKVEYNAPDYKPGCNDFEANWVFRKNN